MSTKAVISAWNFIDKNKKKGDYANSKGIIYGHVKTYLKSSSEKMKSDVKNLKQIWPGISVIKITDQNVVDVYATYYNYYGTACGLCKKVITHPLPYHSIYNEKKQLITICNNCHEVQSKK